MRHNKWSVRAFACSIPILAIGLPARSFAQDGRALSTDKEKLSYSFGVSSARAVRGQMPDADPDLLMRGFRDAYSGSPLLTESEVSNAMTELQMQVKAQQAEMSNVYGTVQSITDAVARKAMTEAEASAALADVEKRLSAQARARNEAAESATTPVLQNRRAKLSYAFGINFANALHKESPDMDMDLVLRGLKDAGSGKQLLLTAAEVRAAMTKLRKRAAMTVAEANGRQGETFLAGNATKEGVITLESGLQYKILKAGEGKKPTIDDTVVCHYRGTLLDGTEFDSSYQRNQPGIFKVQRIMMGWREALQLMPVGSKWQLFIPGSLANWPGGARNGVGPNATLIFELELMSIEGSPDQGLREH